MLVPAGWQQYLAVTALWLTAASGPGFPESDRSDEGHAQQIRRLIDQGRWEEALAAADLHAPDHPHSIDVATALAHALFRSGKPGKAEEMLVRLLEAYPNDPPPGALVLLGRVRHAQGRAADGDGLMNLAVELAPEDPGVLFWAAGAAPTRVGTIDRIKRYLALAEDEDPDRIASARGKLRLLLALRDEPLWVRTAVPERFTAPLRVVREASGRALGYVIDARVARSNVKLLLDTGSSGVYLVERVAAKARFRHLADETAFGGGGDQRHRSRTGIVPRFSIAGLTFANALVTATPEEIDPFARYDGVVGLSVFEGYRVVLDLRRERMLLTRGKEDPGRSEGEPYWDVSGQLLVRASASGAADGLFILDTGAPTSVASLALAGRSSTARLDGEMTVRGYGGTRKGSRRVQGLRLRFQGRETEVAVPAIDLSLRSRLAGVEISGLLGLDLLEGRSIEFTTTKRRVRFLDNDRNSGRVRVRP